MIVGTPNSTSPAYARIPSPPADLIDLLLIDEAHHAPARTWNALIEAYPTAWAVLFTATPFRRDEQEIRERLIYYYPLRRAYEDGIFGRISYLPVSPGPSVSSDVAIAKEAERVLREDLAQGYQHYLMVRTDTHRRAAELEAIYKKQTSLNLVTIHSGYSFRHIKAAITKLTKRSLDGIICVDMLGEEFSPGLTLEGRDEASS